MVIKLVSLWRAALCFPAAVLLANCGGSEEAEVAPPDNQLEMAAGERGLIAPDVAEPSGIFERRKGDYRERWCFVPKEDESKTAYRFAAELSMVGGGRCLTSGEAETKDARDVEGELPSQGWRLRFRGAESCEIEGIAQGDALILPAQLPAACSKVCAGRVALAGAEMERTSWAEAEARSLRLGGADGSVWTECGAKKIR